MPLLAHQIGPCEHLTKILANTGSALDASDTGTGKTYVAVQVAKNLKLPTGIVCPKSVIPSWTAVCNQFGFKPAFIINYDKLRNGTEYLLKNGKKYAWNFGGLVIWDEVHRCKNQNSINAKMLVAAWEAKIIRCLCLSATAAQNPLDMRALGYVLGMHKGYDFWKWVYAHGARKAPWGGMWWRGSQEHLNLIHSQIFPARGVRIRSKDLAGVFPENHIVAEALDMGDEGKIDEAYRDAQHELVLLREKVAEDKAGSALTISLRARQKAELLKVPTLVEMSQDLLEEGRSVVIFVNFNATLELLAQYLKTNCLIRDQETEEREKNLADFQSNKSRVIICNVQAGGVGVSLHDTDGNYPRVALLCPTYNAVDLKQALGRIHRAGGKSPCLQKLIYAAGSIEERVCQLVQKKLDHIDLLNDAEVGVGLYYKNDKKISLESPDQIVSTFETK